ncbi:MAG TPA: class I SAM-dependent methyltransferase [Solirubrobacterales bacterium]|nr:class I SAM-dependent methyltransferase [Solirubrobacterales bacterium]
MNDDSIRAEFSQQTETFATAPALRTAAVLGELVELAPADSEARWLEVACGPGMISRELAPRVGSVHGVDLTPAMVERGRADAAEAGLANLEFSVGDATALELEAAGFDGAITRFSFHHIPAPQRALAEMARVVRPGGWVVVGDHAANRDRDAYAWAEEIERLRDPSHWSCLTPEQLRAMGEEAGLELDLEKVVPLELDFQGWLERSSGGPVNAALIDRLLADPPAASDSFRVVGEGEERRLQLHFMLFRWRRP